METNLKYRLEVNDVVGETLLEKLGFEEMNVNPNLLGREYAMFKYDEQVYLMTKLGEQNGERKYVIDLISKDE